MVTLHDTAVLILGLGTSGLAMARWCARAGARVTVSDTRSAPPQRARLQEEWPAVRFVCATPDAALLVDTAPALVLKSPGLTPAQVRPLREAAAAAHIPVWGELDLFAQALAELRTSRQYAPAIVAVTGTNGKTTVVSLTAQLLARAGRTVALAGNVGPTLLDTLSAALQTDTLPQAWVLELSSFQLADMADPAVSGTAAATPLQATAACVLNLTQDHLDWHGDMAAYGQAKARIFGDQALMVLNRDDPLVMAMLPAPAKGGRERRHTTIGAGLPQAPGEFGIEQAGGMSWLVRAHESDPTLRRRKEQGAPQELHLQRLMPTEALRIHGRHNALNALAALALAAATGCPLAPLLYGLREYRGEPHRVESIGVLEGVEFFDDSKGTNVGATVAALVGLGTGRSLVPILGGDGKGQDFTPLAAAVAHAARAVVLIGRDAPLIRAALAGCGVPLHEARDMAQAVALAIGAAQRGDAVLLSPACASLDMFDNYEHRARAFTEAVQAQAAASGNMLEGA